MKPRRILVIGLDGMTLDLVDPWIDDLPNLRIIRKGGVCGPLQSVYPPLTVPAWVSFMTGKLPDNHGIYEFFKRRSDSYRQGINTFSDLDEVTIWELLANGGRKVGVVNLPFAYPPLRLPNGFFISGLLTPFGVTDFAYPPSILAELEDRFGPYKLHYNEKTPEQVINELHMGLEYRLTTTLHLMKEKPWDVFMVHFFGTDRVQHEFWHICDRTHPQFTQKEFEQNGNVIFDYFKQVDAAVGKLVAEAGDNATIIVMSDHGFGKVTEFFNVNLWLYKVGLLKFKRTVKTGLKHLLFRLGFTYLNVSRFVLRVGITKKAMEMGQEGRQEFNRRVFLSFEDVDWTRTRAYAMGNYGQIFLNLKGREPQGIVDPAEKEGLLRNIEAELRQVLDPKTGRFVVDRVWRRKDIYNGRRASTSPDLVFTTYKWHYKAMGWADFPSNRLFDPVVGTTGHHRLEGLLMAKGSGVIKPGARPQEARIVDLAPTLLYLSGLAIPQDMDGRVLSEILDDDLRRKHPVRQTSQAPTERLPSEITLSDEEKAQLTRHLRDLGYI